MKSELTLDYWKDAEVYIGRIREVPGVFSQGSTVAELEANIRNAYELARLDRIPRVGTPVRAKALRL